MTQEWTTSTDQERFYDKYPTREEAIAGGANGHGLEDGDEMYVGKVKPYVLMPCGCERLLENLILDDEEQIGEWSESWVDEVFKSKEVEEFAKQKIQELCDYIMEKHPPSFFTVGCVEKVIIGEKSVPRCKHEVVEPDCFTCHPTEGGEL